MATVLGLTGARHTRSSEETASPLPASLSAAVELAIQNRTEIRIENVRAAIQKAGVNIAKSGFLPTLDFLSEAKRASIYDVFTGYNVVVDIGGISYTVKVDQDSIPYQVSNTFEFNYNLYSGGKDAAILKEARANQASAEYGKDNTYRKITLDVASAYWELRKAQVSSSIQQRWRDYYLVSLQVAEAQLQAGRIPAIDKEEADLRFQEQEVALMQATREINDRILNYRSALGLRGDAGGSQEVPQLTDDPERNLALPELDMSRHPGLLKLKADIQAASAHRETAGSEFFPKLDFFAQYSQIGRSSDSFSDAYDELHRNYYLFGVRLSINLFEGFRTLNQTRQTALAEKLARIQYEQREQELSDAGRDRSRRLAKAEDDFTLAQKRLLLSQARERVARAQNRTGKYSELEYRKEQTAAQEEADKVLLAKIEVALARLNLLLVPAE